MRVPLTSYGRGEILSSSLLFLAAMGMSALLYWPAMILLAVLWAAVLAFFRDPERHVDSSPDDVLSPADGRISDVVEVEDLPFLDGPALRIGIFMSVFNVHVNRFPAPAAVRWKSYRPGAFHDARSESCLSENERTLLGLELEDGRKMLLSQIAGVIARRIVCQPSVGDVLQKGQRFGMVKFGSRVELCLPLADEYRVLVRPGDRVRAGKTILATWSGRRVTSIE